MKITECAEIVDVEYRSPAWREARREAVSASEIACILGVAPPTWSSPFDLWWEKRTGDDSQAENRAMRRGRRYEALILEDFADEHPEFRVAPSVTVRNIDRPWQMATPDGLAYEGGGPVTDAAQLYTAGREPIASIEAKTGQRYEWGEPGTDEIPIHYRCQVLWQMDTLGLNVAHLPVMFGDVYAEYVVEYDEIDVKAMRDAAEDFLTSVREDRMPEVDAAQATTRRLKRLHPELVEGEVEVPLTIVRQYQTARNLKRAAENRMRLAENRIRNFLGSASTAVIDLGDGKTKTFSHTITEIPARTQQVAAHTRNVINFPRKDV